MSIWFVSRHEGAKDWIREEGVHVDKWVEHLDPDDVETGDTVIGTLPFHIAAALSVKGVRFFALSYAADRLQRGRELDSAELRRLGCRLTQYVVRAVD